MNIMFHGTEIGRIDTNHSMTLEQALYCGLGIDIHNPEDCKKAYESGVEYAYTDDCGNYCIDTENMDLEGEE